VVSPPPIVRNPNPPPVVISSVPTPPPVYIPTPIAAPPAPPAPAPAPPAPPRVSQRASAKGDPNRYFSSDNYPPAALRAEAEGRVAARITIGPNGRVTDCVVTSSSGNADLDRATCSGARRVQYSAARDDSGNPISSTSSVAVRWTMPRD
jgi:protein TonB